MSSSLAPTAGLKSSGCVSVPRGSQLLVTSLLNKGTAFSDEERDALGIRGLLPPRVFTLAQQEERALGQLRRKTDPLEKYIFLTTLQNRNETLFYRLMQDHIEEIMPLVYTPTVGQACLEYGAIFRRPRGLFITIKDKGRIAEILSHWPLSDVRMIVVTDGERILGLGDLGALGMGIPVGKLSLYTACAGLHPSYCLPITLDVGTDNATLRADPLYIGLDQPRVRGAEFDAFIEEFVEAVKARFAKALIQWEDFGNTNAFRLLETYKSRVCSFNDDIQGTAAVAIAGLIASLRITGGCLRDHRLLFYGAGEAGTGIADLFVAAAKDEGLTCNEARSRCWFVDSQGLVVRDRPGKLAHHKKPYAHAHPYIATLEEAVNELKPTVLIGVAGAGRAFTKTVIARMASLHPRPVIFALSNPTSKAECTAEEAYEWSDGRAIFASGSPFENVTYKGRTFVPGQGNNVYIFPGVGLGALVSEAKQITDGMFLTAARALAKQVSDDDLALGRVYPALSEIRSVSLKIATSVAQQVFADKHTERAAPADIAAEIKNSMFEPVYQDYGVAEAARSV